MKKVAVENPGGKVLKRAVAKKSPAAAAPTALKKAAKKGPGEKKPVKPAPAAVMKSVYAKALKAAGYAFDERADRLIFAVKEDTFILMIEEKAPERFSLVSGFTLEKIKYPIEIFEEMNLTMQTTPYVRVYSESAGKKGQFVVLFEISQICAKAQIPMLLKAGVEAITRAMEMFGDMN